MNTAARPDVPPVRRRSGEPRAVKARFTGTLATFVIALTSLLLLPTILLAAESMPRGEGGYYHPLKFLAFLGVFLLWVRLCWWVDMDSRELKQPTEYWNGFVFGCGALGLVFSWMVPFSLLNFPLLVICCLGPTAMYSGRRDQPG